jgi:hypothetical protein
MKDGWTIRSACQGCPPGRCPRYEHAGRVQKIVPAGVSSEMKKLALTAALLLTLAGAAFAGSFRVTYTDRGLIQRITVQAATPYEARRTVQNMFGGYVTGVQKTK